MSPKARQGLVILGASALVLGVLGGAGVALWRDFGADERAVLEPILNPRLGLLIMIGMVGAGAAAGSIGVSAMTGDDPPAGRARCPPRRRVRRNQRSVSCST